ncbi:MAG: hypothetical protein GY703_02945 [Gammaproteobacteria bacterium]|nr:hypothetical protein [Gammaproteobacteria bacterium]
MRDLYINAFHSQRDNRVRPMDTSWENIVALFTSEHEITRQKEDSSLFNGAHYKSVAEIPEYSDDWVLDPWSGDMFAKRRQVNLIENDLLVLDYDGGVTLVSLTTSRLRGKGR